MKQDKQGTGADGGTVVLRPTGRLDRETCGELRHSLGAAFAAGVSSVVVDLRGVSVADIDGLRVIAGGARHLESRGGHLSVTRANAAVTRLIRINELGDLLDAEPPLRGLPSAAPRRSTARQGELTVVPPDVALPG